MLETVVLMMVKSNYLLQEIKY